MGRRPDRSLGASACCKRVVAVIFLVCVALLVVMVATTSGAGVGFGPAQPGGRVSTKSSPVQKPGGGQAGEDAYRSSKRRIPKGPDPIHNRRAGKTTIAPRRRD
ncbi:hypothetical protein CFC21_003316 [Triticum aestivum]|uniref:CLAVATA3/ESR (CLE)-related protein 25-like n=2 Tax=Triticum TaxID=4564 RepID=A0A9R0QG69_TRITD|nr:hypothetical protein CFC21_003316 [Triticum aestivum]VAH09017.1 unnamed protein product [Triticum turgidum subsp. durum]